MGEKGEHCLKCVNLGIVGVQCSETGQGNILGRNVSPHSSVLGCKSELADEERQQASPGALFHIVGVLGAPSVQPFCGKLGPNSSKAENML